LVSHNLPDIIIEYPDEFMLYWGYKPPFAGGEFGKPVSAAAGFFTKIAG
jgi:hypothetical protein